MHRKIGIYGGSFNPPHIGHVNAAQIFRDSLSLSMLFIVPCYCSPFKEHDKDVLPEDRMSMTSLAFGNIQNTYVSDYEMRNHGKSFTFLTVSYIKKMFPDAEIFLLIGSDSLLSLDKWKNVNYLCDNCIFVTAKRDNMGDEEAKAEALANEFNAKILFLNLEPVVISSTEIREELAKNECPKHLQKHVYDYIKNKGIYIND